MNKKFISEANNVINLEIKALQKLKKYQQLFRRSSNQDSKMPIKSNFMWRRKSGLIASKIAATLSSVGTPSFSLAASEALMVI